VPTLLAGFINEMHDAAVTLEKAGNAVFSPHFITWSCPPQPGGAGAGGTAPGCGNLCIYGGRYCAPDPTEGTEVDQQTAGREGCVSRCVTPIGQSYIVNQSRVPLFPLRPIGVVVCAVHPRRRESAVVRVQRKLGRDREPAPAVFVPRAIRPAPHRAVAVVGLRRAARGPLQDDGGGGLYYFSTLSLFFQLSE
jgi:hypothetical protein